MLLLTRPLVPTTCNPHIISLKNFELGHIHISQFVAVKYNWENIRAVWKIHQLMPKIWCKKWYSKLFTSTTFSDAASVINADTHTSATYNHNPNIISAKYCRKFSISTIIWTFHSQKYATCPSWIGLKALKFDMKLIFQH